MGKFCPNNLLVIADIRVYPGEKKKGFKPDLFGHNSMVWTQVCHRVLPKNQNIAPDAPNLLTLLLSDVISLVTALLEVFQECPPPPKSGKSTWPPYSWKSRGIKVRPQGNEGAQTSEKTWGCILSQTPHFILQLHIGFQNCLAGIGLNAGDMILFLFKIQVSVANRPLAKQWLKGKCNAFKLLLLTDNSLWCNEFVSGSRSARFYPRVLTFAVI